MHEEKNDNAEKILHFRILNSAKSKNQKSEKQTLYPNTGRIWTNSTPPMVA